MSDSINLYNNANALSTAPAFSPFTGVKIWADEENYFFSGDETGRVLEAEFPWATQEITDNLLETVSGFVYQPFEAQNALLDPAAEFGDKVSVGGVTSVLASIDTSFDALCASNIAAPSDEEIDHEYHYTKPEKRLEKRVSKMTSELRVMSDSISGVVEDVEGNSAKIEQTAESITAEVTARTEADAALESKITQTADSITAEVTARTEADATLESKITQTAESIESRVSDAEGAATEALQTANGFSQRITDAEGNIVEINTTLGGVAYTSSLADGTTVINGGCIQTGTIDAARINTDNLKVSNGNITSLDVGKLTVNGAAITASNPWDTTYHSIVQLITPADGYVVLDAYGVNSVYGSNPAGSVSWNKIVEVAQNGGTGGTAVFG